MQMVALANPSRLIHEPSSNPHAFSSPLHLPRAYLSLAVAGQRRKSEVEQPCSLISGLRGSEATKLCQLAPRPIRDSHLFLETYPEEFDRRTPPRYVEEGTYYYYSSSS